MSMIFDRDFDLELEHEARQARRDARACHTPAELLDAVETARAAAFSDGRRAGHAEGLADAANADHARRVEALDALGPQIRKLAQASDDHCQVLEAQILDFTLTVCEQVFPELLRHRAHDRALAQVRRALSLGLGSVSLRICVSPEALELLHDDLSTAIAENGLQGRVELQANDGMKDGEARVEWDSGFLEYSFSSICDRILRTLREARPAAPIPLSER